MRGRSRGELAPAQLRRADVGGRRRPEARGRRPGRRVLRCRRRELRRRRLRGTRRGNAHERCGHEAARSGAPERQAGRRPVRHATVMRRRNPPASASMISSDFKSVETWRPDDSLRRFIESPSTFASGAGGFDDQLDVLLEQLPLCRSMATIALTRRMTCGAKRRQVHHPVVRQHRAGAASVAGRPTRFQQMRGAGCEKQCGLGPRCLGNGPVRHQSNSGWTLPRPG
jgi:hypothetical protein